MGILKLLDGKSLINTALRHRNGCWIMQLACAKYTILVSNRGEIVDYLKALRGSCKLIICYAKFVKMLSLPEYLINWLWVLNFTKLTRTSSPLFLWYADHPIATKDGKSGQWGHLFGPKNIYIIWAYLNPKFIVTLHPIFTNCYRIVKLSWSTSDLPVHGLKTLSVKTTDLDDLSLE